MRAARLSAVLALLCSVSPVAAQTADKDMLETARRFTAISDCPAQAVTTSLDEIVVCADRHRGDRYRLPLAAVSPEGAASPARGEAPRALLDAGARGECGIFEGQRRRNKAEARRFGYGGGRDPVTALVGLGTLLIDPDADVAQPETRAFGTHRR